MIAISGLLTDPWSQVFMQRAFLVALMCGLVCGVIGCYVVLRGMAFISDAVAHAVFPGLAIAFILQADLVLGGAIAGLATALAIGIVAQSRRLREDTVIGVFFAAAFGLGIVLLSTTSAYGGSLESFLFGSILGIDDGDVRRVAIAGALLLLVVLALNKELVAVALDRETARAAGLPVLQLDLTLYMIVTVAIVISLQAVGNILVLALLITPAACARLLTDRLDAMMALAAVIGAGTSLIGLYVSYHLDLAAGGTVILVMTAAFVACFVAAPRHGLLARLRSG